MAILDIAIPHFNFPFNFVTINGVPQVSIVEQDTVEDVENCVAAALLTRVGERVTAPQFGVTDPTFELEPVDKETLIVEAERNEPRADITMVEALDQYDPLVERIQAFVGLRGEENA